MSAVQKLDGQADFWTAGEQKLDRGGRHPEKFE